MKFDPHPEDSPLKAAIVERINERDLVYSDLYDYCTEIKDGDIYIPNRRIFPRVTWQSDFQSRARVAGLYQITGD